MIRVFDGWIYKYEGNGQYCYGLWKCFFFFPQFCDGNHPQGDLVMFGYRPTMKVGIYQDPFIFLATCLNNV
jgi:hypothetical protein